MVDWNPVQYARFAAERRAPFDDLAALVQREPRMRLIDLGCGTGELTRDLADRLAVEDAIGLDNSDAMLAKASAFAREGLAFVKGDLAEVARAHPGPFDLVFSNAALHWLPDLLDATRDIASMVGPRGQLAVQVPQNFDHASHVTAVEVARESPFAEMLAGYTRSSAMVAPEAIASLLFDLGFAEQRVRVQVYAHVLPERRAVVEWVRGSLLVDYEARLSPSAFAAFVARYEELLVPKLGGRDPYFFPFKRLLFWARRG